MRDSAVPRTRRKLHPASWLMMGLGFAILLIGMRGMRDSIEQTKLHAEPEVFDHAPDQGFLPYLVASDPELNAPELPASAPDERSTVVENLVVEPQPQPMEDPHLLQWVPGRLIIPAIGLDAPIQEAAIDEIEIDGVTYQQWVAPDSAIGWHATSAQLAVPGNTVLNGHHNVQGRVFEKLVELEVGDEIWVQSGEGLFAYVVGATTILPERYESIEKRLENARWIQPSTDERLTLVTCWPANSNTHRVIVVAVPLDKDQARTGPLMMNLD